MSPLLNQLHWLPVGEIIMTLLYVYKSVEGLSPQSIKVCLTGKRRAKGAMRTCSSGSTNFIVLASKECAGDRAFSRDCPTVVEHFICEYQKCY